MDYLKEKRDEYSITIEEIMELIKRGWKIILVFALILSITLPGYKYWKDKKLQEQSVTSSENNILSDTQTQQILDYKEVVKRVEELKKVQDESIILSIDENNAGIARFQIVLSNSSNLSTEDLKEVYLNYINNGGLSSDIETDSEGKYKSRFLYDVIEGISNVSNNDDGDAKASKLITIRVLGPDKEFCDEMQEVIIGQLEAYQKELIGKVGQHQIDLIDEVFVVSKSSAVVSAKQEYQNDLKALESSAKELYNVLSDTQKQELEENSDISSENGIHVSEVKISWKYAVLGCVAGVGVGIIVILAIFLLSNKFNTVKEFGRFFGVNVIAAFEQKKKDGLSEKELGLLVSKISKLCECGSISSIALCCETEKEDAWVLDLSNKLKEKNIHCKVINNILNDSGAVADIEKDGHIIYIEELYKSKKQDFSEKLTLAKTYGNIVVGVIVAK